MSSPPPILSLPPPTIITAPLAFSTAPLPSPSTPLVASYGAATTQMTAPSTAPPAAVYSPAEITGVLNDLVTAVQGIRLIPSRPLQAAGRRDRASRPAVLPAAAAPQWPQWPAPALAASPTPPGSSPPPPWQPPHPEATATLVGPLQPSLQLQPAPATAPIWPQWPAAAIAAPAASAVSRQQQLPLPAPPPPSTGLTTTTPAGVPIQQVRFPPSSSQLPAWLAGTSPPPVYTMVADQPAPSLLYDGPSGSAGFHAGFAGPSLSCGPPVHTGPTPSSSLLRTAEPYTHGGHAQTPPRLAKLAFATYDGAEDPFNWLNQCEQFFQGQRMLASDRTWLASYHLHGAAQTWYYALEQDEGGMPPWERFREFCLLRFGLPIL
nr:predicted GPI-anchored protein 58 [Aegilops tauschii subsp. strangulata]